MVVETIVITPTKDYLSFTDRFWQQLQLRLTTIGKQANKQIGLWVVCVLKERNTNKQKIKKILLQTSWALSLGSCH
jgi:hypothetical protein